MTQEAPKASNIVITIKRTEYPLTHMVDYSVMLREEGQTKVTTLDLTVSALLLRGFSPSREGAAAWVSQWLHHHAWDHLVAAGGDVELAERAIHDTLRALSRV